MSCRDYLFGDRIVRTALALGELADFEDDPVHRPIRIEVLPGPDEASVEWLHDWQDGTGQVTLRLGRCGPVFFLRFPGLCDFSLDPARSLVAVHCRAPVDAATLEHLLVDQVLPRFLAQEGRLSSHASAISTPVGTLLFLGMSGWGKSTLAGLLQSRGLEVLSDDCVLLGEAAGRVTALPTYESLRLYGDSLANALPTLPATTSVASYTDKRRISGTRRKTGTHATSVIAMYFLNDPADAVDEPRIVRQSEATTCIRLIRHAFQLDITDRQASGRLLQQASAVARAVPAFELGYPRDFSRAHGVAEAVHHHALAIAGGGEAQP